jgi:8-oxo-dGTP pyrophosphatase MutT (NUDIX family)
VSWAQFDADRLRMLAGRMSPDGIAGGYGDHILNPEFLARLNGSPLREAAVLIPVVDRPDGAGVILTKRAEALRKHSGQISFPGGTIDPEDGSPEAAAVREAHEEIGLKAEAIETLARLPTYIAGTGFLITPVLALVRPDYALTLNPDEVDTAFEVPFSFVMDAANYQPASRVWNGKEHFFYSITYEQYRIWGITAGILRVLSERLHVD